MEVSDLSAGDIVVFSGRSPVSWGIRVGTCSPYSHGGIVAAVTPGDLVPKQGRQWSMSELRRQAWRSRLLLFESTSLVKRPCEITRRRIDGVQAHEIQSRLETYPGRVWRMGLVKPIFFSESTRLTERLMDYLATPYDGGGAVLAGTLLLKRGILAPRAADRSTVHCIEVIADVVQYAFGQTRGLWGLKPGRMSPAGMVREFTRSGLYGRPRRIHFN